MVRLDFTRQVRFHVGPVDQQFFDGLTAPVPADDDVRSIALRFDDEVLANAAVF